jgi:hypothetical protein
MCKLYNYCLNIGLGPAREKGSEKIEGLCPSLGGAYTATSFMRVGTVAVFKISGRGK